MDHYVDIRLQPDPELANIHVMNALFQKTHLALAKRQTGDIGVSFPDMQAGGAGLGTVLRLHGSAAALDALMSTRWLDGFKEHVQTCAISRTPADAVYRVVRRVQAKSSADRLRRRQMRRHGYDEAQAAARLPKTVERTLALPFIKLRSASTDQWFRLFIALGPIQAAPQAGSFNAYGLSSQATVPWF